jgi:hypothetical protein
MDVDGATVDFKPHRRLNRASSMQRSRPNQNHILDQERHTSPLF